MIQKRTGIIAILLILADCLMPLMTLILYVFDYSVTLSDYGASSAFLAIWSVATLIFLLFDKNTAVSSAMSGLFAFMLPVSLINAIYFIFLTERKYTIFCMLLCSICALICMVRYVHSKVLVIISSVISVLLFLIVCLVSFLCIVFAGTDGGTVENVVNSPDGIYRAEVVNHDYGATGVETIVNVYDTSHEWKTQVFDIYRNPQQVFEGGWADYKDMQIMWKDDGTLIINDSQYQIK